MEPKPTNDFRAASHEILKRVDQLIRSGEIDQSIREIIHAKEIDPSNFYIRAYEERLVYLKEQHEKSIEKERTRKQAEEAARLRDAELLRRREDERKTRKDAVPRQDEGRRNGEKFPTDAKQGRTVADGGKPTFTPPAIVTPEKVYAEAFGRAWSSGNFTPQQAAALQNLRRELGISHGRQVQIASEILAGMQSGPSTNCILVIDDDEEMLLVISELLTYNGYHVIALSTSDEALALLKRWKPRLVLSDINLQTSTMGGFDFYEKIREMEHLLDVPFVFLSGMSDEMLVRKGKELGIDDYLIKPVAELDLIATVKGKLKRYGNEAGQ